jgi:transposase-like protein
MVTFYRFPREHRTQLSTAKVVESPFGALRLRTDAAKRFKKVESATAVIFKMLRYRLTHMTALWVRHARRWVLKLKASAALTVLFRRVLECSLRLL